MKFLYKKNKLEILESILKGNLYLIDGFNMNQVAFPNEKIVIKPSNVRNMLMRYLNHDISDFEINKWARFVCLRTEYTVFAGKNRDDDEIADFYENMYYIIQCVSTPEIDGDIDEERIKGYLAELDAKYPTDPPEELCR